MARSASARTTGSQVGGQRSAHPSDPTATRSGAPLTTLLRRRRAALALTSGVLVLVCCRGGPSDALLAKSLAEARHMQETEGAVEGSAAVQSPAWYRGPGVVVEATGPGRFVEPIMDAFREDRTMGRVEWMDPQYRAPGNDHFEAAIERLRAELVGAGFGVAGADGAAGALELRVIETPRPVQIWNPIGASVSLLEDGRETVLHAFEDTADVDRTMLPINAPAGDVTGEIALSFDELRPGGILVTEVSLPQVVRRAVSRGAAAVISASIGTYNIDPTGRERHRDAVQYRQLRRVPDVPVAQISQRSFETISAAAMRGGATLRLQSRVEFAERPLRTLIAVVVGDEHPDEVVGISAHLHEPGANDNSSGVATLAECAVLLARGITSGELPRPERSLAFIWGDEFQQTAAFLDDTKRTVIAGISADMTGETREKTGAIALLERMPDPGALVTLPPDEHSAWGAGDVAEDSLNPTGLAVIARCAMLDVGLAEGAWESADHPWEGGSDHDVYLASGVPAVLFWHFTDFAYHTSLDRIEMVDAGEMRRMGTAILATALAVADAQPVDLDRYVRSLEVERDVRLAAAAEAAEADTALRWQQWTADARSWLRTLCLDLETDDAADIIGGDSDG